MSRYNSDYYDFSSSDSDFFTIKLYTILILIAMLIWIAVSCFQSNQDENAWNDGYCRYCEGHMVYSQSVGHRYGTNYIYICEKCGRSIEVHTRMEFEDTVYTEKADYDTEDTWEFQDEVEYDYEE